jgi:choline dehydrogenase
MAANERQFEYVVVGSGAGGGTLAARLAENGFRVLLLEAGGDPRQMSGGDPNNPDENTLPDDYDVPAFHASASENDAMKWDFFVRHYESDALQKKDSKYLPDKDGVLYPRGGCLGGCTAHNAMIMVYPHNEDWQYIEDITEDPTWSPKSMRRYFQLLENCHHRPLWRFWAKLLRINPTRHGFNGWLETAVKIPEAVLEDKTLKTSILDLAGAELQHGTGAFWERIRWFILGKADPNDWRLVRDNATGVRYLPLANKDFARMGSRERVLDVARKWPDRLVVELDALATRVLFDEDNHAAGIEYMKGASLYRAHVNPASQPAETRQVRVSREVILCGGTYNTPQLLMLSGIGPREELEKHGIAVRADLPGVGSNLQDRYEIAVVNRMNFKEWWVLKGAKFAKGDPQYLTWEQKRDGVYATNGAVSAVFLRSFPERPLPDLFCFALIGPFRGYYPGYSKAFPEHRNYLTWSVLKAHTKNNAGHVRLRSADPRDTPLINFRYFTEGSDEAGEDLKSAVEGIKFVRKLTAPLKARNLIAEEELPGEAVKSDAQIADYVQSEAWGHHACGTCAIGARNQGGVVNGNFEVYGTRGLRVVDASVFPKIPGFFIVSSVYTIGEKAADVITKAARRG